MECVSSGEIQASLGTPWCMVHMHWVSIFYTTIGRDWQDCKTVHVFVGLTSVMPPFFCQHFLWCSYLPFINPTSGYVCNDNGLHTDAAHLSVTGYNVSYWPSHPMAYPSSVFLALAHTFSIINSVSWQLNLLIKSMNPKHPLYFGDQQVHKLCTVCYSIPHETSSYSHKTNRTCFKFRTW